MNAVIKKISNINKDYILIFIFSIIFSLLYFFITPFYDSTNQDVDSYIFRNIAYLMDNGLVIYKDILDNKGPLLYFLNLLFYKFSNINLLYITSLIIIFINNIFLYKISKLYIKKEISLIIIFIINGFFISVTRQNGFNITNNMVEFFALPFFTYVYYKYISVKKWEIKEIILSGVCFSVLFLLRVNLSCINVICFILVIYKYIKNKNYKSIPYYTFYYMIGALIIIVPCAMYFIYNNAFSDFIKDYFGFNILYSAYGSKVSFIGSGIISFIVRCIINFLKFSLNPYIIFIILFYIIYFINIIKSRLDFDFKYIEEFIIFIFCYALSIFVSNRFHMHYIWIMLCFIISPICKCIIEYDNNNLIKIIYKTLIIISVVYYGLGIKSHIDLKVNDAGFNKEYELMKEYIKNNVKDNESVFAGIYVKHDLYYKTHTLPGNKYVYQYFYEYFFESSLMDDFMNSMVDNPPSKLIYEKKNNLSKADEMMILLCALEYDVEYENNKYIIYKKKLKDNNIEKENNK